LQREVKQLHEAYYRTRQVVARNRESLNTNLERGQLSFLTGIGMISSKNTIYQATLAGHPLNPMNKTVIEEDLLSFNAHCLPDPSEVEFKLYPLGKNKPSFEVILGPVVVIIHSNLDQISVVGSVDIDNELLVVTLEINEELKGAIEFSGVLHLRSVKNYVVSDEAEL